MYRSFASGSTRPPPSARHGQSTAVNANLYK